MQRSTWIPLGLTLALAPTLALAQLAPSDAPPKVQGWRAVTVAEGVAHPWAMAWLPDGRLLVTSKEGTLHLLNGNRFEPVPLDGLPKVYTEGQGGLLDIAVHPLDKQNPRIYLTLSTGSRDANRTTLVQGRFDGKRVAGIKTIFKVTPDKSGNEHFGSRLAWLADGTLLMSIGDGGNPPRKIGGMLARDQAQQLSSHNGSLLRLTDEGKPAPNNPLAARPKALPEIWSFGHRNIQGLTVDPSGRVWATEHGPRGGDELNLVEGGRNYGWPVQSFGADYATREAVGQPAVPGMVAPLVAWVPSPAPSGLVYYTGSQFPRWRGSLLSGGLAGTDVRRIILGKDGKVSGQERLDIGKRVRDVRQGPDGQLYLLTDESNGKLLRIVAQ